MSLARAISLIDGRVYTGPMQVLSDPTDLLHRWAASAPSRNSPLLSATLRRSSDGVEADFATDARGYLPRAEVLAWAGASAVTVARLWGSAGTQLEPELLTTVTPTVAANSLWDPATRTMVCKRVSVATDGDVTFDGILVPGTTYIVRFTSVLVDDGSTFFTPTLYGLTTNTTHISAPDMAFSGRTFVANSAGLFFRHTANGRGCRFVGLSVRALLTANAVQTTTNSQPQLDLTANPLRIGASASKSLVATLPAAITGARVLTADENGVAVATANLASGAYTVQSANALRERVVLAADTPEADVDAVKRNMMRAWRLGAAV